MMSTRIKTVCALAAGIAAGVCTVVPAGAAAPERGGILKYVLRRLIG